MTRTINPTSIGVCPPKDRNELQQQILQAETYWWITCWTPSWFFDDSFPLWLATAHKYNHYSPYNHACMHAHGHTCTHAHTHNCFMALWILSRTTRVSRYQKKHSPTHTYRGHQSSFTCFIHLLQSMASTPFNPRAWQSFSTISLRVFFGLPLGLAPSTSYSIHFFTQSLSSWHNTVQTYLIFKRHLKTSLPDRH